MNAEEEEEKKKEYEEKEKERNPWLAENITMNRTIPFSKKSM